jgi:hypothetical protein
MWSTSIGFIGLFAMTKANGFLLFIPLRENHYYQLVLFFEMLNMLQVMLIIIASSIC